MINHDKTLDLANVPNIFKYQAQDVGLERGAGIGRYPAPWDSKPQRLEGNHKTRMQMAICWSIIYKCYK